MQNIINWFKESNRWKHFVGGVVIGLGANDLYCAAYAGAGVAAAMELKDKLWGGEPDWIDLSLTFVGSLIGYVLRIIIISMFI